MVLAFTVLVFVTTLISHIKLHIKLYKRKEVHGVVAIELCHHVYLIISVSFYKNCTKVSMLYIYKC